MAWRQKQWKYKNTAPKVPKKEEFVTGISASRLMMACGNYIQASSKYMAFNIDGHGGGALGMLPLDTVGPIGSNLPIIYAHGSFVSDFGFSPHDDTLLATIAFDNYIKLWRLEDVPSKNAPSEPLAVFPELPRRGDALSWNPLVSQLMSVVSSNLLRIYDVNSMDKLFDFECHDDVIHGACWSQNGAHIATVCKDKLVRIFDPRSSPKPVQFAEGHPGVKDSRIVYVNNDKLVTTGYDSSRSREIRVYDGRNLSSALHFQELDNNPGTVIPLFDADTDMLYLAGKGDNNVRFMESSNKMPYVIEAACDNLPQLKGCCLVPKRAVDVMKGEVNRLLILNKDSVVLVPYIIPRRSYAEFHVDVFPETYSGVPGATVDEWVAGANPKVTKVSLDPQLNGAQTSTTTVEVPHLDPQEKPQVDHGGAGDGSSSVTRSVNGKHEVSEKVAKFSPSSHVEQREKPVSVQAPVKQQPAVSKPPVKQECKATQTVRPLKWSHLSASRQGPAVVRTGKYRHLKGTPLHRSLRIENIRNLNISTPGESDAFAVNGKRCAINLQGPAGFVAVLEYTSTGRLDDAPLPSLTHGSQVMDFVWNPFNDQQLATATESGAICIWNIPEDGLKETSEEPDIRIAAHNDKIYSLRFHPSASGILASSSQDLTVKIWDLDTQTQAINLQGHTSAILSISWSQSGAFLATLCKDGLLRVYDPRSSTSPVQSGPGPSGSRGGRIVWVTEDKYLAVSGFDKQSNRLLELYDPCNLRVAVAKVELDTAPAILIPHYDEDTSTIFLTSRGDTMVQAFEVSSYDPYLTPLSIYHAGKQHQALGFLPKNCVDVKKVEFARGYRLTQTQIEPVSFTIPRVKMEYFQDDVFPETRVIWKSSMNAEEWLQGGDKPLAKISLQPQDMEKLSDAPPEAVKEKKYGNFDASAYKSDAQKRDELVSAVTANLNLRGDPLPQDLCDGVDSDEWDED